jgi:hypothetical protein
MTGVGYDETTSTHGALFGELATGATLPIEAATAVDAIGSKCASKATHVPFTFVVSMTRWVQCNSVRCHTRAAPLLPCERAHDEPWSAAAR